MAFFHEKANPYPKDHEFTNDDLAAITPSDICKWMNFKAFGTSTPEMDANLVGSGSSSLEFMKKAVSFYMPEKGYYNDELKCGNPTRSRQVKELLQKVSAMGGKTKREVSSSNQPMLAASFVGCGGRHGLLRRVHAQNTDLVNILGTMGSALRTFGRSLEQMKSALETSNIVIRHQLSNVGEGEENDDDDDDIPAAPADDAEELRIVDRMQVDFATLDADMKNHAAQVAETLQDFMKTNVVGNRSMRIVSGVDGFCAFISSASGKQLDLPEGFDLPSVDLIQAWHHWLVGFPDFKVKNDNGDIVDAPIRPLRFVNTGNIPQSLKKKFKDGWRPIFHSLTSDVTQLLESTSISEMDEIFIQYSYSIAMKALKEKAPAIFTGTDGSTDKYSKWKVATWSRKIREHQLGQQQLLRRGGESIVGVTQSDMEDDKEEIVPVVVLQSVLGAQPTSAEGQHVTQQVATI